MFVARGRRKVAHRRCAMSLPEGHEHRHIAPRWGAVPSAVCSTNIQLLTELEGMASHNVPNSRALRRDSLLILSVLSTGESPNRQVGVLSVPAYVRERDGVGKYPNRQVGDLSVSVYEKDSAAKMTPIAGILEFS